MRLGVDTGGTFTDFVWLEATGRLQIHKQLSTPLDPSLSILSGVDQLQVTPETRVVHGSTVATNALLERRGARTALITTAGFGDVLAIGRQNRPDLYALVPQKPPSLIPRAWRFEVTERVDASGVVLTPLDAAQLQSVLEQLKAAEIESVAVCLLFSYLQPAHEQQIRDALEAALPHLLAGGVSLSSEILPEYREYERTATTVINAYVVPLMSRYLQRLAAGLQPRPLTVMQSNGGIISADMAGAQAARTALSGPAGGVVGANFVATQAGFPHIITFDMGGTSTDVALCDGQLPTTTEGSIADMPLRLPIIDIHTVGAGGGSLARVDVGGALHVGPESAGADPGPACYQPVAVAADEPLGATVTDANLVLGRLDAEHFLGGSMRLNEAAAQAALTQLAQKMGGIGATAAAWGLIQVANANMERAIRRISVERGFDPRRFTLVPFGGAGPLHACELAQNLQIPRVFIPRVPGVLSALGMLVAAPTKDYSRTVMLQMTRWDTELAASLRGLYEPLQSRALTEMAQEGYGSADVRLEYKLDMRYQGQSHELSIPLELTAVESDVRAAFDTAHDIRFGYRQPDEAVEIVTIRLLVLAPDTPPELPPLSPHGDRSYPSLVARKPVRFGGKWVDTKMVERDQLAAGAHFDGPAIIFQYDTTTVVPPAWQVQVDASGNMIVAHQT